MLTGVAPGTPIIIGRRALFPFRITFDPASRLIARAHGIEKKYKKGHKRHKKRTMINELKVKPKLICALCAFCEAFLCLVKDVAVLPGWVGVAFVFEEAEGADQFGSCLRRLNNFVDESSFRGDVGIGELVLQFQNLAVAH